MAPGAANMPCCSAGADGCTVENTPCEGDLVCSEVPPAGALCAEPCAVPTDCTLDDVMGCEDGICVLDRTW